MNSACLPRSNPEDRRCFIDHLFELFKFCLEEPQVFGFIDHF